MKSLQTKFLVLILSCVLLSSFVIGGAGIISAKRAVDRDSTQIMNLLCDQKAEEFDALLSRIEQSVKTLAEYSVAQLDSIERLQTDELYAQDYIKRMESIAVNAAENTEGALAVYIHFSPELLDRENCLFFSRSLPNGSFRPLPITDLSLYSPEDIEHVGWYYLPLANGKPTWMSPYLNKNLGVEMISYVIPIYKDNVTIGVVGMDIDSNLLKDMINDVQVYENGYAYLSDAKGQVIYHKDLPPGTYMANVSESLQAEALALRNDNSGGSLYTYTYHDETKKMTFQSLINGMRLVITAPAVEIDAARTSLTRQILIATCLIILLAVVLTVILTGRIVRPLRELNTAAQKIAAGDLSISLNVRSHDEVGTLAASFQQTANHLQHYIDYINSLAYRDALTGVKNKTAYQEAVDKLEQESHLGRPEYAVMVLDINGLKGVNDHYGHDFGDMLIIDACKLICRAFRHSPVFRVGGDEFVVILEGYDYLHYEELLAELQKAIDRHNQGAPAYNQVSIARGIAVYNEENDLTFNDVFKRADNAMYQNKAITKEHLRRSQE